MASGGSPVWLRCSKTCWWRLQLPAGLRVAAGLAGTLQVPLGFTQRSAASRLPPGAVLQPAASSAAGWGRGSAAGAGSAGSRQTWLAPLGAGLGLTDCRQKYCSFSYLLGSLSWSVPLSAPQVVAVAERNWLSQREKITSFIISVVFSSQSCFVSQLV